MKLGSNNISAVRIGSTIVNKIYIGANQIWPTSSLLLDTYTGAAAAYSLRKLRSGYSGSAIEVRIDTTGQPTYDIGFVDGELDTATLEGYCTGGLNAYVTTWYDQSGNGNDITQTTASQQGQIVSSGSVINENSKPTCKYDGSDDTYTITLNISNTDTSIFAIGTQRDNSNRQDLLRGSSGFLLLGSYVEGTEYRYRGGSSINSYANIDTNQNLHTAINTSTQSKAAINGNTLNIVSDTHISESAIYWGNYIGDPKYTWVGNVQELIFYFSDQSSNRTGIETNINDFYSIY